MLVFNSRNVAHWRPRSWAVGADRESRRLHRLIGVTRSGCANVVTVSLMAPSPGLGRCGYRYRIERRLATMSAFPRPCITATTQRLFVRRHITPHSLKSPRSRQLIATSELRRDAAHPISSRLRERTTAGPDDRPEGPLAVAMMAPTVPYDETSVLPATRRSAHAWIDRRRVRRSDARAA